MSQPLLRVVCLFTWGVVLAGSLDPGLALWISALGVALVAFFGLPRGRPLTISLVIVSLGGANLSVRNAVWSSSDLRLMAPRAPVLATVRGKLVSTPRLTRHTRDGKSSERTLAELRVTEVRLGRGDWQRAVGRVAVSTSGTLPDKFHRRRVVEVDGVLTLPPLRRAPGLFDYRAYLRNKGIHFQLRAEQVRDWRLGRPEQRLVMPLTERFIRWSRHTLSRGLPDEDPATGLIQAMTLGWKTALTDEVEEPFMKSGTMHIFAISGLHILLMAGMVLSVLRLFRIPRAVCGGILIPLLWFYSAATGWQSSAVRATVMMTIVLAGWSLHRPSNLVNSLGGAALFILTVDPRQLFQASFQFSFGVVLALALMLPPLQAKAINVMRPDPLMAPIRRARWRTWLVWPVRWAVLTVASSLAAWLGAMPLSAHYFHLFSPGTLFANVLSIPCASATLASALASLATGSWFPWLSEVFNHSAWFWMHCMMRVSAIVADSPGTYRYVASPGLPVLLVYYGTLLAIASGCRSGWRLRWLLSFSGLLIAALLASRIRDRYKAATVTALPLNGGLALHVKPPNQFRSDLIDCGPEQTFHAILKPYLQARGENRLEEFFLTHGDIRHVGAGPLVLEIFEPARVVTSPVRFRSTAYRALVREVIPETTPRLTVQAGETFDGWDILYPPPDMSATRADEAVLVLRRMIHGISMLLISDLDRRGQRRLLAQVAPSRLRADILVTGIPGDREPLVEDFIRCVQPELVIVGDDEWPAGRRATPEMLSVLRAHASNVLSTRQTGAIQLHLTRERWRALRADGRPLVERH